MYRAARIARGASDTTLDHSGRAPSFSITLVISQDDRTLDNEIITTWPFPVEHDPSARDKRFAMA